MSEKLRFIKPSLYPNEKLQTLTLERIKYNYENGITTNLIPDTNILITMEKCADIKVNNDQDRIRILKEHGLKGIFDLFNSHPNIAWCPIFSLSEMPGKDANYSYKKLKSFDKKFKLECAYEEDNINDDTFDKQQTRKTIDNFTPGQKLISYFSYCSLLLIQIIEKNLNKSTFDDKINLYIRIVIDELDLVSMKEFFIACIVFYSSSLEQNNGPYKELIKDIRNNFYSEKKSKSFRKLSPLDKMKSIASNGTFDLALINICNASDFNGIDEEKLDNWIVSFDNKLFNLVRHFPHVKNEKGESALVYYNNLLEIIPEHKDRLLSIMSLLEKRKNTHLKLEILQNEPLEIYMKEIESIIDKFHKMAINGI
jgi:hypothetical protein